MLTMMKSFLTVLCLVICSTFSGQIFAQQGCPSVSTVKKWEVVSSEKILAYDNSDQYYFFMTLNCCNSPAKVGGQITLRFFSSTICKGDTVIVNGTSMSVISLESIRR
jgi:hypothetical protein